MPSRESLPPGRLPTEGALAAPMSPAVLRRKILRMAHRGQSAHVGCALSIVEICAVLYGGILRLDRGDPAWSGRDLLVLSKGHGAMALYACLHGLGWLGDGDLANYLADGTRLRGLCEAGIPGCEVTGGSLGHGLPIAVGMAYGLARRGSDRQVYCIVGDGELNEGSMWEAVLFAAHHRLENLVVIVDANRYQAMGPTADILDMEPLEAKFAAFGFATRQCDGHDLAALEGALGGRPAAPGRPLVVVARTEKGHGVSFIAGDNEWHYTRLSDADLDRAEAELD